MELLSSSMCFFSFISSINADEESEEGAGVQEAEDEEAASANPSIQSEDGEAVEKASSTAVILVSTEDEDVPEDMELLSSSMCFFSFISSINADEESEEGAGVPEDEEAASANPSIQSEDGEPVEKASSSADILVSTEDKDVSEDTELLSSAPEDKYMSFSFISSTNKESKEEAGVQEASPTAEDEEATSVNTTIEPDHDEPVEKASSWLHWLVPRRKKQRVETEPPSETAEMDTDCTEAQPFIIHSKKPNPIGQGGSIDVETLNADIYRKVFLRQKNLLQEKTSASTDVIPREELVCLGFPNLAQTCYMNSTLQGLLTLRPFVHDIIKQKKVWMSHPGSKVLRRFVDVGHSHFNGNKRETKSVLAAFKDAVAEFNSEFKDHQQKDAHEFLSSLLNQMKSLNFDLQESAVNMGFNYTCPVDAHITFQMLSTRTCKGCGKQSMREEDYINLSLDLVHGGSVNQCLKDYLKLDQLEYRCECGAEQSTQRPSFLTLPNVLILQLKRFSFTKTYDLVKVQSPVVLSRELLVNPESSVAEQTTTRYSLVSIVSHLGSTANSGHYICDGAYRPGDNKDRWLTYNDKHVSETTGASVCHNRQQTAYLLFYVKQVRQQLFSMDRNMCLSEEADRHTH
ncbi:ubiquitin carboxyl-terminal hydrolase 29-like isoform X1 [Centropristis striata]|uniref:ubiquitin carboxyl-terminal hydrolase 29-like isoform X1 n=1 Tax=Centropristis striata TaxID=184440 RepID=UPI0027E01978|nr:ubiquitin carboxyl-terminal hydrolase 29-like isoform X1 [Centropristis striata]XP_059186544.1 ubiquitin carboxyl-terminal hydrolase 29-like isoform X1 [Centropristis striata]